MKKRIVLSPYLMWSVFFIISPLSLIFLFAFTNVDGNFTVSNLKNVFIYSDVFLASVWLGIISTAICLFAGYPLAYCVSRTKPRIQKILITLIAMPMWMNLLLKTYAWVTILEDNGLINKLISFFGIERLTMMNTPGAVIFGMVYSFVTYMILPIYSVLIKTDKNIIEAAQDLGANQREIFFKITLPLSVPGIISGISMVFIPSVSTFVFSRMLGGGTNLLIADIIDMQFLGSAYNPRLGSAISLVLMALVFIFMGIINSFDENKAEKTMIAL
ncbi:MAG: ABC transporter permease [Oscillospiraceae bacterium]|nr:ABC transporter permease [Oscillospiraceae bacterium]